MLSNAKVAIYIAWIAKINIIPSYPGRHYSRLKFNDENPYNLGKADLFNSTEQINQNEKAISLLKQLIKEMATSKEKEINLSDSSEVSHAWKE